MSLKLFNTLGRRKELFKHDKDKNVLIYCCGPTVYDYAHIGNFRTFLFEDILIRYLQYKGYKVKFVMNITDIEDKTIKASSINNVPLKEYTKKYEYAFSKNEIQDFALWKAWVQDDKDVFWNNELGKGRPGWHIECSVMSTKLLNDSIDIHAEELI